MFNGVFLSFIFSALLAQQISSSPARPYRRLNSVLRESNTDSIPFGLDTSSILNVTSNTTISTLTKTMMGLSNMSSVPNLVTSTTSITRTTFSTVFPMGAASSVTGTVGMESSSTGSVSSSFLAASTEMPNMTSNTAPCDHSSTDNAIANSTIFVPGLSSPTAYYTTTIYQPTAVVVPVSFYPTFRTATIRTVVDDLTDANGYVTAAMTQTLGSGMAVTTTMVSAIPDGLRDDGWKAPGSATRVGMPPTGPNLDA